MKVTIEGNRNLYIDGAKNNDILGGNFRNFRGEKKVHNGRVVNDEGTRNFNIAFEGDAAQALADMGVNVKVLPGRDDSEGDLKYAKVNVKLGSKFPPNLYMVSGGKMKELTDSQLMLLDMARFENVDLVIRLYSPEPGKMTMYLQKAYFTIEEDPISAKYRNYIPEAYDNDSDDEEIIPFD